MNKKLMYAAMALPMLFTACSQDELFEEANGGMNTPKVKGYKVDLVTTKGDVTEGTRADWTVSEDGAGLIWSPADKISVYWLNDETGESAIKGHFNSVYETGDGSNFTSKALIYEGGNVAVFPADLAHTKIKTVDILIAQNQGEGYANNTPYISNYLNVGAGDHLVNQKPGYEKPLFARQFRQGTNRKRDRCVRWIHGIGDRPHRHPVPHAQPFERSCHVEPSCPMRPRQVHLGLERDSGKYS